MNWIKENRFKVIAVIVILIILGMAFYWFQYRPYKARKDCAWTREHTDAIPYRPESGSDQAKQACIDNCKKQSTGWAGALNCEYSSECANLHIAEQQAEPEKNWWEQTTESEYKSCLRGKGF